jgi:hypothetical protein
MQDKAQVTVPEKISFGRRRRGFFYWCLDFEWCECDIHCLSVRTVQDLRLRWWMSEWETAK